MNIYFKNNYTRTKEIFKEIYQYYFFKRKIEIVFYTVMAVFLVLNLYLIYVGGFGYYNLILFILLLFFPLLSITSYHRSVNISYKRDIEISGDEIEVETIVTEDYIQNTNSTGAVNKLKYSDIRYAVQTKSLILLFSKAGLFYIFPKDSFVIGTKEEFITFLKELNIKIKGK